MLTRRLLRVALVVAVAAMAAPATAAAGQFSIDDGNVVYDADEGTSEQIAGFEVGDVYRFTRFGEAGIGDGPGCELSDDGESVDCPKAGVSAIILNLGDRDDIATVAQGVTVPVFFFGGSGNDGLFGGGGVDSFFGGDGNDNVVSRDGRGEQVDCGDGQDTAISDDGDNRISCEEVEGDADGDGVRRPADCNDANPGIRPGAADAPDDGVDQDCSGADATNLDVDGDGSPRPQDCNDGDPAIRPGAREVRGNGVDENCDTRLAPFSVIGGRVSNVWAPAGSRTVNVTLLARQFRRGTRVQLVCAGRGCPFRSVRRRIPRSRRLNLHRFFGNRALAPGTRVELRFTRRGHVGRILRFRIRSTSGVPSVEFLCRPPGRRTRSC